MKKDLSHGTRGRPRVWWTEEKALKKTSCLLYFLISPEQSVKLVR